MHYDAQSFQSYFPKQRFFSRNEIKFSERGGGHDSSLFGSFTWYGEQTVSLLGHLRVSTFRFHHFYRQYYRLRILSLSRNCSIPLRSITDVVLDASLNARNHRLNSKSRGGGEGRGEHTSFVVIRFNLSNAL